MITNEEKAIAADQCQLADGKHYYITQVDTDTEMMLLRDVRNDSTGFWSDSFWCYYELNDITFYKVEEL